MKKLPLGCCVIKLKKGWRTLSITENLLYIYSLVWQPVEINAVLGLHLKDTRYRHGSDVFALGW